MTDEKKAIEQAMEAAVAELKAGRKAAADPAAEAPAAEPDAAQEPAAEPSAEGGTAAASEEKPEPKADRAVEETAKKEKSAKGKDKKSGSKKTASAKKPTGKSGGKKSASAALKELAKVRRNKIIGITAAVIAVMLGIFLIARNHPADPALAMARAHGGEPTVTEDGVKEYPDGTKEYSDGTVENPDGSVAFTDGSVMSPDGTVTKPDGTVTSPDGTVTKPDGTVVPPSYSEIGDSDVSNVQGDNGGAGGVAETPWSTLTDGDYQISIRRLNPYSGPFLEDGSDEEVSNILALQFRNDGENDIQYAEYVFNVNGEDIPFKLTNLPAKQSCVVLSGNKHAYNANEILRLKSRLVATVEALPLADDRILAVDNGDNTATIMNMTSQPIPVARVFYKTYYAEQDTFVGGITYTIEVQNIPAGGSVTVDPQHFNTGLSMFVGSGVYDS